MLPESGNIQEHRSIVPRVARILPRKPSRTSFGNSPLWSICAWVSSTISTSAGRNGKA
jgi:hypothetical protein